MQIDAKKPEQWRVKFALIPRLVGRKWIWLESYCERFVDASYLSADGAVYRYERMLPNGEQRGIVSKVYF